MHRPVSAGLLRADRRLLGTDIADMAEEALGGVEAVRGACRGLTQEGLLSRMNQVPRCAARIREGRPCRQAAV
jgi:hypothetical protein